MNCSTRTVPGDRYYAAYWRNDFQACIDSCEPNPIRQLRRRDNRHFRAFNCRGDYFQGTTRSGITELVYAHRDTRQERNVFRFNSTSCE
ncbi:MAG: hypothetical protein ACK4N5_17605 [Myxococcales bacterium]